MEYIKRATKMCILTASMYYVMAKVKGFTLLYVDMLPLQGEHWQTDQMMLAYLSLVAGHFSRLQDLADGGWWQIFDVKQIM